MLFTIRATGPSADNLSWLLHKNPARFQTFNLHFAKAHVFYPTHQKNICEACLLVEPIPKQINKLFRNKDGEFKFVNEKLYTTSSFLCTAIAQVYSSAFKGVCPERQELVDEPMELEAVIDNFPNNLPDGALARLLEPLGYEGKFEKWAFTDGLPNLGTINYGKNIMRNHMTLRDLLCHLYILVPVCSGETHYWQGDTALDIFKRASSRWLPDHPEKEFIIRRYFKSAKKLKEEALRFFCPDKNMEPATKLNDERYKAIVAELVANGASSVIDLGCGDGKLLALLAQRKYFSRIAGMDISARNIAYASERIEKSHDKVVMPKLFTGSLTYHDKRLDGYDAAVLCEVIEHFELQRMSAVMRNILEDARPRIFIMTTPNKDYNANFTTLNEDEMRHPDHRHEFTENEFKTFCDAHAAKYGYSVRYSGIGFGSGDPCFPTIMGVFTLCA